MRMLLRKRRRGGGNSLFLLSLLIFIFFDIAAASQELIYKDFRPQRQIFEDQKATPGVRKTQEEKGYLYNPTGMTDPFKSFIAIRAEREEKKKRKPRTYLETLDLSSLNLSVIVIGPKGKWAMVQDSKGLGHVIKEGTAIGTNGGVVYQIKAGEVVVREEYSDFRGRKRFRDIAKKTPSIR
jgi:Tfp pilus assembly protein PilP